MTVERQGKALALFDMDGTLLPWDTQYLFSCFIVRRHGWRRLFLLFYLLCLPLYLFRIWDETRMKRAFLSYLWGLPACKVLEYGREFAVQVAHEWMYPEVLARLKAHQEKGDVCVMVSASPSFYAEPLGRLLGFDAVLGTDVELGKQVPLMPELPHGNNKGEVKVRRLRSMGLLPKEAVDENAIGYSDSSADIPMLMCCLRRVLVNPSPALQSHAGLTGAECLFPARPWRSRSAKLWEISLFVMGLRA